MCARDGLRVNAGRWWGLIPVIAAIIAAGGCRTLVESTDREVDRAIARRQQAALGETAPASLPVTPDLFAKTPRAAYQYVPTPVTPEVPAGFQVQPENGVPAPDASAGGTDNPAADEPPPAESASGPPPAENGTPPTPAEPELPADIAAQPTPQRQSVLTLTAALGYGQDYQRAYQTAKEDLYLSALALTLERHLWTPIFAANLRTIYGNFGQVTKFDQAMRFVSELSVAQRLPYGGRFTASAISTLIRDVGHSITAAEGSAAQLGLEVPFLRGAGHVAQENLIQLERDLTYSVRTFERYRRAQLVAIASGYFDLLRSKQRVADDQTSLKRVEYVFERARAFQEKELGTLLDTQRAEAQYLDAANSLEESREIYRSSADQFKLLIGMPVDEPLGLADIESIEQVEQQVAAGDYPLLLPPPAIRNEPLALQVAVSGRLDLLNLENQIDDARRGVAVAKNALLPDLNLASTVTWDTDPEHYQIANFSYERTTWRSELLLSLPIERTAERNAYRASLIDVQRAARACQDLLETIRADVRRAIHRVQLADRSLEIQEQNLVVAEKRLEYARIQYLQGDIGNRDLFEAENEWTSARATLNRAKTERWSALLDFRLATETLRIDDEGRQEAVAGEAAAAVKAQPAGPS